MYDESASKQEAQIKRAIDNLHQGKAECGTTSGMLGGYAVDTEYRPRAGKRIYMDKLDWLESKMWSIEYQKPDRGGIRAASTLNGKPLLFPTKLAALEFLDGNDEERPVRVSVRVGYPR